PSSRVNVDESQCLMWNNIGVPFRPRSAGTSVPVAAQLAAGLVELVVHLATQEDDSRDDGQRDESHEEDVLDQVGAPLVLRELGLQPSLEEEEVHGAPFGVGTTGCPVTRPHRISALSVVGLYHPQWFLTC